MSFADNIGDRKIIILSNDTVGWTKEEIADSDLCLSTIQQEISASGYESEVVFINTSSDLKNKLSALDPDRVVILNWVEEIDNLKYGYHIVPELLDQYGFVYTGNNSSTLTISNSKIKTNKLLKKYGVTTPRSISIYRDFRHLNDWHIYPSIIKPAREHCSFGISPKSVVDNQKQLMAQAKAMFAKYHQPLLVEEFICGPEYFVSVWGYDDLEILPLVCQDYAYTKDYHQQIYDYTSKWDTSSSPYHQCLPRLPHQSSPIPTYIKKEVTASIRALNCQGYTRLDIRVRDNTAYIIDINPNPDISYDSDFVLAASRLGFNYGQTILKLCDLAIKNYASHQSVLPLASPSRTIQPLSPALNYATI